MKLINADTLKHKFNQTDCRERGFYPNNLVDSCCEIKAIPISWIKSWCKENPAKNVSDMLVDWKEFNK